MTRHARSIMHGLAIALAVTSGFAVAPVLAQGGGPPGQFGMGGPGGPGGGGVQPERKLVAQFDTDGDKRLNAVERKAARDWMSTQPMSGRGGPGGGVIGGAPPGGGGGFGPGGRGMGGPGGRGGPGGGRGMPPSSPGKQMTPADVKSYAATTDLYDITALRTVFLQFENADWEAELAAFNNTDVEVPARVIVDGKSYKDVGVHFRGNSSYFSVPDGSKRSLNLSFDFTDDKQSLLGYRTLNLLNVANDATFTRTTLYGYVMRQFTPAPKTNYMRVVINGENWGVYINAEQFNKDFLKENYGTTEGARWKVPGNPGARGGMDYRGDAIGQYTSNYEIKTKDDPKQWVKLIQLFKTLNQTPVDQLPAAIEPMLDVDGVLKFLAVDVALVNGDGYWTRSSDYDIYLDPKGVFHVIAHDMNEALGGEGGGGPGGRGGPPGQFIADSGRGGPPQGFGGGFPGGPGGARGGGRGGPMGGGGVDLDPLVGLDDANKPLRSKLLAVPAYRQRYLAYVKEIATKWLDWKTIGPMVTSYQALVAADVALDTKKLSTTEAFTSDVAGLKNFIDMRRAYLLKRLGEM